MDEKTIKAFEEIFGNLLDKKLDDALDRKLAPAIAKELDSALENKIIPLVRKEINQAFEEKFEEKFIPIFLRGYESVIEPQLEDLRKGQARLEKGQKILENGQKTLRKRVDTIDKYVNTIDKRLVKVEKQNDDLIRKFGSFERKLDLVLENQLEQNVKITQLERRVTKLENSEMAA